MPDVRLGVFGKNAALFLKYMQLMVSTESLSWSSESKSSLTSVVRKDRAVSSSKSKCSSMLTIETTLQLLSGGKDVFDEDHPEPIISLSDGIEEMFMDERGEVCVTVAQDWIDYYGARFKQTFQKTLKSAFKALESRLGHVDGPIVIAMKRHASLTAGDLASDDDNRGIVVDLDLLEDDERDEVELTVEEMREIIEAIYPADSQKTGNREWLKPETDLIKIEAAKVKKKERDAMIDYIMTDAIDKLDDELREKIKQTVEKSAAEMRAQMKSRGFSKLI